jgi:tetratricopeptide (TPR) repeat protein
MKIEGINMKRQYLFIIFLFIVSGLFILDCSEKQKPGIKSDKQREYANALYNRELYDQSVTEYQRYLDLYHVDNQQQANINFIIGNIYFDRLHDYENSLAYYLKVRHIFPESNLMPQVDKQIVQCLERLERSADAKQALDEATSLDLEKIPESRPGTVIARIGDREITSGDLKHHLGQLPEYLQSQFKEKDSRIDFLKQYVATELFYDAAKRKGLDNEKDVIEGAFQAKKSLMVQKYLQDEISSQLDISEDDVELYFKANKEKYAEKDDKGNVIKEKSLQEVQKQVAEDMVREKQEKLYGELLKRMMTTAKVEIYDDLVE